jgi:hypothetical protein
LKHYHTAQPVPAGLAGVAAQYIRLITHRLNNGSTPAEIFRATSMMADNRPSDSRPRQDAIRYVAPLDPHGLSTLLHLAYDPVLAVPASARIAALLRQLE